MILIALLDFFRKNKSKANQGLQYAPTQTGYTPTFTAFGDNIYASDLVVQSIRCKANEFKKLNPRHIRLIDNKKAVITEGSIARVLKRPNAWMTTSEFLEKITILLELNKNVYIYPEYYLTKGGYKYFTGLYPLKPSRVEYLTDEATNKLYIHFYFSGGKEVTLPQNEVIHWRKDYGVSDYFGGSLTGSRDTQGLLKMLQTYDTITQSIAEATKCSLAINGIIKVGSLLNQEELANERIKFENALKAGDSGIAVMDMKSDYINVSRDIKLVDKDTLNFFYEAILRNNGVSLAILSGDYTSRQKAAFYEHALEADIISLGQAISKVLFSDREESFGNEVVLYPARIDFMSMAEKISYLNIAAPAGALNINEMREIAGLAPIPNGDEYFPRGYNNADIYSGQSEDEAEQMADVGDASGGSISE